MWSKLQFAKSKIKWNCRFGVNHHCLLFNLKCTFSIRNYRYKQKILFPLPKTGWNLVRKWTLKRTAMINLNSWVTLTRKFPTVQLYSHKNGGQQSIHTGVPLCAGIMMMAWGFNCYLDIIKEVGKAIHNQFNRTNLTDRTDLWIRVTRMGDFWGFFMTYFLIKVDQILLGEFWGYFQKTSLWSTNCCGHLLGNFWKNGLFFILTSGHTESTCLDQLSIVNSTKSR